MSIEEIIRLIFSLLGGGIVVAILNWVKTEVSEKKTRKIDRLINQLDKLYGPLYFFSSQNDQLFKLARQFNDAYTAEYVNIEYSQDESTQAVIRDEANKTIDVSNKYVAIAIKNNEKVLDILLNNYQHIDLDDIEIFQQFLVDYTRLTTEKDEEKKMVTPLRIYFRVGEISYMRPEFIDRVKRKFHNKIRELQKYQAS